MYNTGGWAQDLDGNYGAMIEYILCLSTHVNTGARILHDYDRPTETYQAPKFPIMSPCKKSKIVRVMKDFLHLSIRHQKFQSNGNLWRFVETAFACFLMRLPQIIESLTETHPVITGLKRTLYYANVEWAEILQLGIQIKLLWDDANKPKEVSTISEEAVQLLKIVANNGSTLIICNEKTEVAIQQLSEEASNLKKENVSLKKENSSLKKDISYVKDILENIASHLGVSPGKRTTFIPDKICIPSKKSKSQTIEEEPEELHEGEYVNETCDIIGGIGQATFLGQPKPPRFLIENSSANIGTIFSYWLLDPICQTKLGAPTFNSNANWKKFNSAMQHLSEYLTTEEKAVCNKTDRSEVDIKPIALNCAIRFIEDYWIYLPNTVKTVANLEVSNMTNAKSERKELLKLSKFDREEKLKTLRKNRIVKVGNFDQGKFKIFDVITHTYICNKKGAASSSSISSSSLSSSSSSSNLVTPSKGWLDVFSF
jgi:hypothetical protein